MGGFLSKNSSSAAITPAKVDSDKKQKPANEDTKDQEKETKPEAASGDLVANKNDKNIVEQPSTSVPDKADEPSKAVESSDQESAANKKADLAQEVQDKDSHTIPVHLEQIMDELAITSSQEPVHHELAITSSQEPVHQPTDTDERITEVATPSGEVQQHGDHSN